MDFPTYRGNGEDESEEDESEKIPEVGDEHRKLNISTLLDRLLYCRKLPRYAPLEIDYPSDPVINAALEQPGPCRIISINELAIRVTLLTQRQRRWPSFKSHDCGHVLRAQGPFSAVTALAWPPPAASIMLPLMEDG